MTAYAQERKEAVCRRLMDPHEVSLAKIARDTGIGKSTLHSWRKALQPPLGAAVSSSRKTPKQWSSAEKFAVVCEATALSEAERAEYARRKGLLIEQITAWTKACRDANGTLKEPPEVREQTRRDQKRIHELERELRRKERALAEAAALLVLRKKAQAIWGDEDA